jgi:hypothetical protein
MAGSTEGYDHAKALSKAAGRTTCVRMGPDGVGSVTDSLSMTIMGFSVFAFLGYPTELGRKVQ